MAVLLVALLVTLLLLGLQWLQGAPSGVGQELGSLSQIKGGFL